MNSLESDRDPVVLGPFELLAVLGQGGMGRTYLARKLSLDGLGPELEAAYHLATSDDQEPGEPVLAAVKVIRPALLRDGTAGGELQARARFAQEVSAIGSVVDPRVPALLGADTDAERPWLAMDYIHGPTLHTMVKKSGPFGIGKYAALGLALVEALRAIHGSKLYHRDLKPGNIALGPEGPVVLDFGLAVLAGRDSGNALTRTGVGIGSKPYMPLEQVNDLKHVEAPGDVYALGATLFFAATGGRDAFPHGPMMIDPDFSDVPPPCVPLLAKILVQYVNARPSLDAVESSLRQLLAQHGLSPEAAATELRQAVDGSGLVPELPAAALAPQSDPEVQQAAQHAVNSGRTPDSPWHDGPDLFEQLFPVDDSGDGQDHEPAAPVPVPRPADPPAYVPTLLDPAAHPAPRSEHLPHRAPAARPPATSYRLAPPQPPASGPLPAAVKAADRLRKAYAHSGRL